MRGSVARAEMMNVNVYRSASSQRMETGTPMDLVTKATDASVTG
jgi:hypothetical protein